MKKLATLLATALCFVAINLFLYQTLTRRLANNFSGANQLKMIDVARYLPFEENSTLARTGSSLKFQPDEPLPILDGAAALAPVYAAVIENCYPRGSVRYKGGAFSDDNYYGENFAPESVMQYQNTIRGFNALVDGKVDLFFGAAPSPEQRRSAQERGVELVYTPIGREAFVFFVNRDNRVSALSSDQLRAIYRGELTNWQEVGGDPCAIWPVKRIAGSGTHSALTRFLGDEPAVATAPLRVFGRSIGCSFRFYVAGIVGTDRVKMLAVDGIAPTIENIKNGTYPIVEDFYVVHRQASENPNVARLVEWLLSEEGQRLIEASGYSSL